MYDGWRWAKTTSNIKVRGPEDIVVQVFGADTVFIMCTVVDKSASM